MSEYMWGGRVLPEEEAKALKAQGFQLSEVKDDKSTSDGSSGTKSTAPKSNVPEGK
jgi:hypothetical protein